MMKMRTKLEVKRRRPKRYTRRLAGCTDQLQLRRVVVSKPGLQMRKKRNVRSVIGWLLSLQLSEPGAGVCCAFSIWG